MLATIAVSGPCAWQTASAGAAHGLSDGTYFFSSCAFSHMAPDDPIVFARAPGFSHEHTFVGNVSTNAFSTLSTLRSARTTCNPQDDTAAYWAPALYVAGKPVPPLGATIYYERHTTAPVRPFPFGLRMVAGSSHAVRSQSLQVTFWDCGLVKTTLYGRNARPADVRDDSQTSSVPLCPPKTTLQLHVSFPDCWSGKSLDSTNHRGHMAYSSGGRCPSSHPVALPAITLVYRYSPDAATRTTILSSGGQHSGHADFINTWRQSALAKLVESCLNERRDCGPASAPALGVG